MKSAQEIAGRWLADASNADGLAEDIIGYAQHHVLAATKEAAAEIERLRRQRDELISILQGISRQTAEMVKAHS